MIATTALMALALSLWHLSRGQAQDATGIGSQTVQTVNSIPTSGTSEIQTLTIQASTSGGTFTLTTLNGRTTAAIAWSAVNATMLLNVDNALEALPSIGTAGVTTAAGTLTAGIGTITLTFTGKNAKQDMPALSVTNNLITGGTIPTIATTTAGVEATLRNAITGQLLVDRLTPDLYINDSLIAGSPTWTKVSP